MRARPFLILYLLSGAAALLYEVAWLRLLTLSMGHTTAAVGTVLAAFMGGLAAGAWIAGLTTPDLAPRRALRIYAALECAVALCALAMPLALGATRPLLAAAYANGAGGTWFDFVRLAVSVVLIGIPAIAMGASFPIGVIAVRDSAMEARDSNRADAAELYAANTVGAACGAALTGFVLLPSIGLFGTTLAGVLLNGIAAAGAVVLSTRTLEPANPSNRRTAEPSNRRTLEASNRRLPEPSNHRHAFLAATTLSISGFVALVYEVAWTRVLAMTLGPTTYAFSAMLVAFVAGLAIGSAIAATRAARVLRPGMWLGVTMMVSAAAALIA